MTMEKLKKCRICLVENVRMYLIANKNLQEIYEKLTNVPFVTEDSRPMLACFLCYAKLKQCHQLQRKCLEAEELFAQIMNEDYEPKPLINQDHLEYYGGFIKSPTENISIVDVVQTESIAIKQELPAVCEELDDEHHHLVPHHQLDDDVIDLKTTTIKLELDLETKDEEQTEELGPESLDRNSLLDVADKPPHHSESDSEGDFTLTEFNTELLEEVSKKKRRAKEMKRVTFAKQPKLDTRRTKPEDAVTAKKTKKDKSGLKVVPKIKKQISVAEWAKVGKIGQNPGSDVDEDLLDTDILDVGVPRHRHVEEYPADLDNVSLLEKMVALDALDDVALGALLTSEDQFHFDWSNDAKVFTAEREQFTSPSGPTFSTDGMTPLDIFERIWDEAIINLITIETNRYAKHLIDRSNLPKHSTLNGLNDITKTDVWSYFAILMLQSFVPNPLEQEYWYPPLPYLQVGKFEDIMSFKKFLHIQKYLHFVDNTSMKDCQSRELARIFKVKPILDHLNHKFSNLYLPEQKITIDESLLQWKGSLSLSQLIAAKSDREGIKSLELCEARTGYLWKMDVSAGNQLTEEHDVERGSNETEEATSQIVYRLVRPLLNKGHTLVMDNFYNSPLLSRILKSEKTDTMGPVRLDRENLPDSISCMTKSNMRVGEVVYSHTQGLSVFVWRDSNLISMLSTYHKVEVNAIKENGVYKYKPRVVLDYDRSLEGVNKKDKLLQAFPMERIRNTVWYKKFFRRLLNFSIHNAYVIFTHQYQIPQRQFRMTLVDEILKKYNPPRLPVPVQVPKIGHFPVKKVARRCKECAKENIDSRSVWACDTCGVNLCITGCFRKYHIF